MNKLKKISLIKKINQKYEQIYTYLNERTKRIWAVSEAIAIWSWWKKIVYEATKIDYKTIKRWILELENKSNLVINERIRIKWWWRKKLSEKNKKLKKDIEKIIESSTRWDPEAPLLRCSKSLRKISNELVKKGYKISHSTIWLELKDMWYSLQSNRKTQEWWNHEDRDKQFNFIYEKTKSFQLEKQPVISVDTKKKENIGNRLVSK